MDSNKPLTPDQAKLLAVTLIQSGAVLMIEHASQRGAERSVTFDDACSTLRGGVCVRVEWNDRHEQWRYLFETTRFGAVVAFEEETQCIVITVWRKKR